MTVKLGKKLLTLLFFAVVLSACEYTVKDPNGVVSVGESVYMIGQDTNSVPNVLLAVEMTRNDADHTFTLTDGSEYLQGYVSDGIVNWKPEYRITRRETIFPSGIYELELLAGNIMQKPTIPAVGASIRGIESLDDGTFRVTLSIYGDHDTPVDGLTHVLAWTNTADNSTRMFESDADSLGDMFVLRADTATMNGNAEFLMMPGPHDTFSHFTVYSGVKLLGEFQFNIPKPAFALESAPVAPAATVTASVYTLDGSGIMDGTLQYAWTQSAVIPDDSLFKPFVSHDALSKTNASGDWYLHVAADHPDGYKARTAFGPYRLTASTPPSDPDSDTGTDTGAGQPPAAPATDPDSVQGRVGGSQATSSLEFPGKIRVDIPGGVLSDQRTLTIAVVPSHSAPSFGGRTVIDEVMSLQLDNGQRSFDKPLTLTFYYDTSKLAAGQQPSVYYYHEQQQRWIYLGGKVNDNGTISVSIDHFTQFAVFAEKPLSTFADMDKHWAMPYTGRLIGMGIIAGFEDGLFKPDEKVTRAQFARMIASALDLKAGHAATGFADDAAIGAWAKPSVAAAVEAGLISGYKENEGTVFKAGQSITRAEIAAMIAQALGASGVASEQTLAFRDSASIHDAVAQAVQRGIVNGFEDGTFRPGAPATRAEAARMLYALLDELDI